MNSHCFSGIGQFQWQISSLPLDCAMRLKDLRWMHGPQTLHGKHRVIWSCNTIECQLFCNNNKLKAMLWIVSHYLFIFNVSLVTSLATETSLVQIIACWRHRSIIFTTTIPKNGSRKWYYTALGDTTCDLLLDRLSCIVGIRVPVWSQFYIDMGSWIPLYVDGTTLVLHRDGVT